MGSFYRKEMLKDYVDGQEVSGDDLIKKYLDLSGNTISSYYNFLAECKALGLIEKLPRGKYKINKGADYGE